MLQFIKYVFATIVGIFLFSILSLFIIIGIGSAVGSSKEEAKVEENTVLKLDLDKPIVENVSEESNPFSNFGPFASRNEKIGLVQIREILKKATSDKNIKGIYLQAHYPMAGYAQLEEIRNALLDFKQSGKFVYSYGEAYSEKGYYLSSISDKIYLNPAGGLDFNGISIEYTFFKGLLDKLDIKPTVFRVGEYKSFVEPFIRENMSDASKEQTTSFLNSINNYIYGNIAKSRGVTVEQLKATADSLSAYKPEGALASKLVTNVGYYDEFEAEMKKALKLKNDEAIEFTNYAKYLKIKSENEEKDADNKIAVVVAEGEIVGAKGDDDSIGSDDFVKELKKAREDNHVKAIVLSINSPGGSSLASDVMWREIELTKKVKPVIASMGTYAASGGYYMAMAADKIVAQPTTITGSIGIFGMVFNIEGFLKNKIGITNDRVSTNAHSDVPTATRELTDFEKNVFQSSVEKGYETFTSKAAKGRHMSIDKLKSIASGRVWTGIQAKDNGLVDELGGLNDAIKLAAKTAKLKDGDYKVRYFPTPKSWFESLMNEKEDETEAKILQSQLGDLAIYAKEFQKLKARQGILTMMPYTMELK